MTKVMLVQVARPHRDGRIVRPLRVWFHGLTLPYLAALFSPRAEVRLVDELAEPIPYDEPCDIVGLTFMGTAHHHALEVARRFRQAGRCVIAGGPVTTAYPDLIARHVDAIVVGDAEGLVDRLLDDHERGRLQPVYQHPGPLKDLSMAPLPRYDLIRRSGVGPYFPIEATRGCSVGCSFCASTHLQGGVQRRRPIDLVVRDAADLAGRGVRRLLFVDENPMLDRRYFVDLLDAVAPFRFRFTANSTADVLDDEPLLDRLAAAGCESLSVGFETLDRDNLAAAGKGHLEPGRYTEGLHRVRERGIQVVGMFVLGFDRDGPGVFDDLERFLLDNRIEMALFHILTPVPGTPLHAELARSGRLVAEGSDTAADRALFEPARMSRERLETGFWELQERYYSIPSILRRLVFVRPDRHYLRRLPTIVANLYFGYLARERRILI